jgi:hypothetical protein
MLTALSREMLVGAFKDILSNRLKIVSNHFNDLQIKQDQDYADQLRVRVNPFLLFFII